MSQGGAPTNPPPSTRSTTRKATFDRVVKEVIGIADNDILLKALDGDGFDAITDLLTMTDDQIDSLAYDDGTSATIPPLASRNKLRILRSWNFHLQQVQGTRRVNWMDTNTVNEDTWDEYRIAVYVPAGVPTNPAIAPGTGPAAATTQQAAPST